MTTGARKNGKGAEPERPAPSVGQGDMSSIPKVDLDLHGDAIDHWQDEPQPTGEERGAGKEGDRKTGGRR